MIFGRAHRPLLEAWQGLLASEPYQKALAIPREERPAAFYGDQDVLWALLVSEGFADLSVDAFRTGRDLILHCAANGYSLADRLKVLAGARPALVHMLGPYKPWSFDVPPEPRRQPGAYLHYLSYEVSPFLSAASPYADELGDPAWLRLRSLPARLLNALALNNPALAGLPFAAASTAARSLKRGLRAIRQRRG